MSASRSRMHEFALGMDAQGEFWIKIPPSQRGAEPTWSKLPQGYTEKDGVRMEVCLRAVLNARIAAEAEALARGRPYTPPKIGAPGAPTSLETERWFTDKGVVRAKSTLKAESAARREALLGNLSALLGVDVKGLLNDRG